MKFEKNYTEYWEKTVNKSVDGTFIAGSGEAKHYLELDVRRERADEPKQLLQAAGEALELRRREEVRTAALAPKRRRRAEDEQQHDQRCAHEKGNHEQCGLAAGFAGRHGRGGRRHIV